MIFELLVLAGLEAALLALLWIRWETSPWTRSLAVLALLPIFLHLFVAGYRWQMAPVHLLAIALLAYVGVRLAQARIGKARPAGGKRRTVVAGLATGVGILAIGVSALATWLFPVFQLPEPTGPHQIGVTRLHLVDEARPEPLADDPDARRELMVQVWYPAEPTEDAEPAPYLYAWRTKTDLFLDSLGLPSFLLSHFGDISSHSYYDAPPADSAQPFPVLLFSHGYRGMLDQNVAQMEELASHGYAVASIGHPYDALAVVFPDGRVVRTDPEQAEVMAREGPEMIERLQAIDPEDRAEEAMRILQSPSAASERARLWAEDIRFVLDKLERLNVDEHPLQGRLDLSLTGALGHSLGGIAAGQACITDDRLRACLNMDGPQWGDMVNNPANKPIMFMMAPEQEGWNDGVYEAAQGPAYLLVVEGSAHLDFSDQPLWSPLMQMLGVAGPIGGERAIEVVNAYSLAFFDRHLRDQDAPLLRGLRPDFLEVIIRTRGAD